MESFSHLFELRSSDYRSAGRYARQLEGRHRCAELGHGRFGWRAVAFGYAAHRRGCGTGGSGLRSPLGDTTLFGTGRPSIAPEMLLRAMLLQAFYSVRSERQLMDRLEFDLLFRWFVGLGVDDPVWNHSTFSKNRDRLLDGDVAAKFLAAVLAQPRVKRLLSSEHFSVDGTLIMAWASMKSLKPKDGKESGGPEGGGRNAPADFKGQKRSNETHRSTTDPDAKLYRKGPGMEARLCFIGHGLMENRSGLIVDACLTRVAPRWLSSPPQSVPAPTTPQSTVRQSLRSPLPQKHASSAPLNPIV